MGSTHTTLAAMQTADTAAALNVQAFVRDLLNSAAYNSNDLMYILHAPLPEKTADDLQALDSWLEASMNALQVAGGTCPRLAHEPWRKCKFFADSVHKKAAENVHDSGAFFGGFSESEAKNSPWQPLRDSARRTIWHLFNTIPSPPVRQFSNRGE